ncbi:hypothetical protein TNCV_623141 [Trichonephila clavipes]|nr:hypothetical protein TNCV_623141 [Trichonephila clavipes]
MCGPKRTFSLGIPKLEVAGAAAPQGPRDKNCDDLLKTECRSLRSNHLSELTLDYTSERGSGDSHTRELITSRSSNLKPDSKFSPPKVYEEQTFINERNVLFSQFGIKYRLAKSCVSPLATK